MDLRTAIAPTFTLDTAETFEVAFSSGTSPITVTMAAADYRMVLAPSTGSVIDYVRAMTTAIQAAVTGAGRSETALVTVSSDTGLATIALTGAEWSATEVSGSPLRRLGFGASITTVIEYAYATRPVLFLALFVERVSVGWQTRQVISQTETLDGRSFGLDSGIARADDDVTLGFIPRDPTYRASLSLTQTALNPADAYVASVGVVAAREWSVVDVLNACVGQSVAFAFGTWQTVSASTTDRYDVGSVRAAGISDPVIVRVRDGWDAYYRVRIPVVRRTTETRA